MVSLYEVRTPLAKGFSRHQKKAIIRYVGTVPSTTTTTRCRIRVPITFLDLLEERTLTHGLSFFPFSLHCLARSQGTSSGGSALLVVDDSRESAHVYSLPTSSMPHVTHVMALGDPDEAQMEPESCHKKPTSPCFITISNAQSRSIVPPHCRSARPPSSWTAFSSL